MHVNIGHRLARSEIYGPGVRSVLWLQGCTLACKGCWNTQFWSPRGGIQTDVSSILAEWEQQDGLEESPCSEVSPSNNWRPLRRSSRAQNALA